MSAKIIPLRSRPARRHPRISETVRLCVLTVGAISLLAIMALGCRTFDRPWSDAYASCITSDELMAIPVDMYRARRDAEHACMAERGWRWVSGEGYVRARRTEKTDAQRAVEVEEQTR